MTQVPGRVIISMVRQATRDQRSVEVPEVCGHCKQPCWVTRDALEHAEVMATRGRRVYYFCIDCMTEASRHGH